MNQILMEERRGFLGGMGKIGKTNELLDQLQNKMHSYFDRKKTHEDHLLNSEQEIDQPNPKIKNTFKLFPKQQQPMRLNELESATPVRNPSNPAPLSPSRPDRNSQVGQLLEEVEAIETLVRKRLALKEERIAQMETEVQMESEEKVHLYKINCQLEEELKQIDRNNQERRRQHDQDQVQLQREIARLKKVFDSKKAENKRLKKQEELVRDAFREAQRARKGLIEAELKGSTSKGSLSRGKVKREQKMEREGDKGDKGEEQYLRGLVVELDKLRSMVKQKMKKSTSKSRVR